MFAQTGFHVRGRLVSVEEAKAVLAGGFVAAIGHEDTAAIVAAELGFSEAPFARITITVQPGDQMVVAQYRGPRLPEGARTLPPGARIEYWVVIVE